MEHIEMIEKLREKAGITREEAADALNRAGWDMLEALRILEREGKIAPLTSSVVSAEQNASGSEAGPGAFGATGYYYGSPAPRAGGAGGWEKLKQLFMKTLTYSFIVRRRNREILSLPVLVMIIVVLALFRVSAVALLVGLFCECRYSVEARGSADQAGNNEGNGNL